METKGNIAKIIKFSAVDGPGNRGAIFLQGCNFNCGFCHNPETIGNASSGSKFMSVHEVFEELGNAINFIRGITVSGGEATLQKNFVKELFEKAKKSGLDTFLDTNGSIDLSEEYERMSVTDFVMLDIKSIDEKEHINLCGKSNDMVLKNFHFLAENKKLYEVRTVISPNMIDCGKTVCSVSKMLKNSDIIYKLIKYRPNGVRDEYLRKYKVASQPFMKEMENIALENGVKNIIIL